jgi:hypothetical protein
VQSLVEMGFPEDQVTLVLKYFICAHRQMLSLASHFVLIPLFQCQAALNAAFGDPSRAVEYLMNGIPEGEIYDVETNCLISPKL